MRLRSGTFGYLVILGGVILAAWVVAGRYAFGVGGELTLIYAVTLGVVIVLLHAFIGRAILLTVRRGHRTRPSTLATLAASWLCGILLGLMIPDITPLGLQTILTGTAEPGLGIAIGVSNPLGIICVATAVVSLVLATGDARGRREPHDHDYYDQAGAST